MPKKTRRQKKLADKHRVIIQRTISHPVQEAASVVATPLVVNIDKPVVSKKKYIPSEYDISLYAHTIADIKKTLLITVCLFALEFLVFYAKLNGNLR